MSLPGRCSIKRLRLTLCATKRLRSTNTDDRFEMPKRRGCSQKFSVIPFVTTVAEVGQPSRQYEVNVLLLHECPAIWKKGMNVQCDQLILSDS